MVLFITGIHSPASSIHDFWTWFLKGGLPPLQKESLSILYSLLFVFSSVASNHWNLSQLLKISISLLCFFVFVQPMTTHTTQISAQKQSKYIFFTFSPWSHIYEISSVIDINIVFFVLIYVIWFASHKCHRKWKHTSVGGFRVEYGSIWIR